MKPRLYKLLSITLNQIGVLS